MCYGTIGQSARRSSRGRASERMPPLQGGIIRWDHLRKLDSGSLAGNWGFPCASGRGRSCWTDGGAFQMVVHTHSNFQLVYLRVRQLPLVKLCQGRCLDVGFGGTTSSTVVCHRLIDLNAINKQCHHHCPVSGQCPRPSHPCPFLSITPTQYTYPTRMVASRLDKLTIRVMQEEAQ